MKILYTYKVGKPTFEEASSKNADGTEVTTKNKVYKDVDIFIKKPSHREIDDMDLYYSIQISDLQSKGVATNTMILNNYQDVGGLDSKKEVESIRKLLQDLNIKRNKLLKEHAEKIENPGLLEEIKDLTSQLQDYQTRLNSIFDRSAESIAERRVILWAVLNLLFVKDGEKYNYVFAGVDHKDKIESYYNMLDSDDDFEFEKKIVEKGQIFLSAWLRKQIETEEDFKLMESIIDDNSEDE